MSTNTIVAEYDNIYASPVQDYKKYKFEFEKQKESLEKEYKIVVTYPMVVKLMHYFLILKRNLNKESYW